MQNTLAFINQFTDIHSTILNNKCVNFLNNLKYLIYSLILFILMAVILYLVVIDYFIKLFPNNSATTIDLLSLKRPLYSAVIFINQIFLYKFN